MSSNSTTAVAALAPRHPGVMAIIGFMLQPLFIYGAIQGLQKGNPPYPDTRGRPWIFSMSTGLDGKRVDGGDPLTDAGGPVPEISLFNDMGELLGFSRDHDYAKHNRPTTANIYPRDINKHEGQFATFVFLTAVGHNDPVCIVDMTLIGPDDADDSIRAFGAITPRTCGFPWYHSGVHREGLSDLTPCFWFGGFGTEALQVHMPSHTFGQTSESLEELNKTTECSHDWFCNRPAIMHRFETRPKRGEERNLLIKDREKRGGKTLEETQELHEKGYEKWKESGLPKQLSRITQFPHQDTITIAHQLEGLSAIELCEDALSAGPDYVNIVEGKFCRMSDKTLWPTCDHQTRVGPRDDCFDVDSRQLVIGGKMTRSKPYSKEINFPLKH